MPLSSKCKYFLTRFFCLTVTWICLCNVCIAQEDYQWWNDLVDWDGRTHWSKYLIYSPRYFGPNAIPIPELEEGLIKSSSEISFGTFSHFTNGESTYNSKLKFYIPYSGKIAFYGSIIPVEYYSMDTFLRDRRKSRDFDGIGYAIGDLEVGTQIQLLTAENSFSDVILTSHFKTALGTNREAARYLDAPAYYFHMISSKTFVSNQLHIKPMIMCGLYVWQTNEDKNPQNDAILYGAGVELEWNMFLLKMDYSTYNGYKNNGDHSSAIRTQFTARVSKYFGLELLYNYGLNDNLYQTIGASVNYQFKK